MAEEVDLTLSREQLRFVELLVSRNNLDPSSVDFIALEGGSLRVRLFDKTGAEIGSHVVEPRDNELPY